MLFLHGTLQNWSEGLFKGSVLHLSQKQFCPNGNVPRIPFKPLLVEDVGVGAEGLHEPLGSTIAEELRDGALLGDLLPEIKKSVLILLGVIEVGVINK